MVKNIASYVIVTLTILSLLYVSFQSNETIDLSSYSTKGLNLNYTVKADAHISASEETDFEFSPYLGKSFVGFKEALAFKESGGNYASVNTYGYLGKYQFGSETLKLIGINNPVQFLKSPKLQEKAFIANAARNKWILRRDDNFSDGYGTTVLYYMKRFSGYDTSFVKANKKAKAI